MAYFSNGTEGMMYEDEFCSRCIHYSEDEGCPVWNAHLLYSYRDCNDETSILHFLIPRSKNGLTNEQCKMFVADNRADLERQGQGRLL